MRMRLSCLVPACFALRGTTEPIHRATRISPFAFAATCFPHVPDLSSSALLAKKKSSSQEDSSNDGTIRKTSNWQWLQEHFQMTDHELSKISVRRPQLLTMNISALEARAAWLQNRLALDNWELSAMIQRSTRLLECDTEQNVKPTLDYLQKKLAMDDATLSKTVQKCPSILSLSIDDGLEPKLNFLQSRLQLDDTSLGKLIRRNPSILAYSLADNIEPTLNWLQQRLDLNEAQMGKLITRAPSILSMSIKDNLEPKLKWLQERLHLTDAQVSKIVRRLPTIFCFSVPDKLEPTLKWLQGRLSLDGDELAHLIEKQPTLIGLSIPSNLEPTLEFYSECIGVEGTKQLLVRNPALFGYSLERRLKPRLEQLKRVGLVVDAGCLALMAKYTDAQWQTSLVLQTKKMGNILKKPQHRDSLDADESKNLIEQPPRILSYDSSDKLGPALAFYICHVGVDEAQKLVTKFPSFLTANVEEQLKPRMKQFEQSGLVLHPGWLKRMATYSEGQWESTIANNQQESIEPIQNWLGESLVLDEASVNELIDRFPRVLVLNISEHLEPLYHFYTECIGIEEARRFVATHPRVLGTSLEKRLQPRLEQVQRARMVADAAWLKSMALDDEERWAMKFEDKEKAYWRRN